MQPDEDDMEWLFNDDDLLNQVMMEDPDADDPMEIPDMHEVPVDEAQNENIEQELELPEAERFVQEGSGPDTSANERTRQMRGVQVDHGPAPPDPFHDTLHTNLLPSSHAVSVSPALGRHLAADTPAESWARSFILRKTIQQWLEQSTPESIMVLINTSKTPDPTQQKAQSDWENNGMSILPKKTMTDEPE
ncbi:hypothetical protein LTR72_001658 [Exophiala xenobiotica]|nr:hypothetical protein LTR72_001658 [Exophiala xenobiotica]KAK5296089.1 hypothetical protein LTR14_003720 [Exophiala xenobiotica]KAK5492503.1 hypothetical protein LTR55_003858 [Exophiala xenobiotica]